MAMSTKSQEEKDSTTNNIQISKPRVETNPFEEIDRLFDKFLYQSWLSPTNYHWPRKSPFQTALETTLPHVDVIDRENEIVIRSEVPGLDKKDLEVSMTENTVTIKGNTRKDDEEKYYCREIFHGAFSRTLNLPCDINSRDTKSTLENGVLELIIPKANVIKRHTITFE